MELSGDHSQEFGQRIAEFITDMRSRNTEPHQKMLLEVREGGAEEVPTWGSQSEHYNVCSVGVALLMIVRVEVGVSRSSVCCLDP